MDHVFNIFRRHRGEGKVVARGEADDPAQARFALRDQQSTVLEVETVVANRRFESRKVVVENKRVGVVRVENPAHPRISRAKVASGVIFGLVFRRNFFDLPLPWTPGAVWRYQHPLVGEGIQSAMWILSKLQ
jgi:hypothetical protein